MNGWLCRGLDPASQLRADLYPTSLRAKEAGQVGGLGSN